MAEYSQADFRRALYQTAHQIISAEVPILLGGCALYNLAGLLEIDKEKEFSYLRGLHSACLELPLEEEDRFGRHPDWLAELDQRVMLTEQAYKERVLATCKFVLKTFAD